jgi:integrase
VCAVSPPISRRSRPEGIVARHQKHCSTHQAQSCDCRPSYQAQVYAARDRKTLRKTFPTVAAARAWRTHAQAAIQQGHLGIPTKTTLAEAGEAWLEAARSGVARTRSGDTYKPSAIRAYEQALRTKLLPELGTRRLTAIVRNDVQDVVDGMVADGLSAATVRNAILPLRVIYRRALARSEVLVNPTVGLALPACRGRRDRVAQPLEAHALLEALPAGERALWATALYAGLRRGELRALRWCDVDFEAGVIRVERGWDDKEGPITPKSRAGVRRVPLAQPLRVYLAAHRLAQQPCDGERLVFARPDGRPVATEWMTQRARRTWEATGIKPIGLHECRHTFASFSIAAGVNAKSLQAFLGHSSITMTMDRYGHLMAGAEDEAATLLTGYLRRATTAR